MTARAFEPAGADKESVSRVHVRLPEWTTLAPRDPGAGAKLRGLTLGDDPEVLSRAQQLARAKVVIVTDMRDGLRIETGSYVGRIALGPLDITIVPKVAWQRWNRLLGFALRLSDVSRSEQLTTHVGQSSLQDLLVLELVHETRGLMVRGLHREYERLRRPLAVPRGRIDFARIARAGFVDARIPSRFTRRVDDTLLNRVLRGGLVLGANLASDPWLRSATRQLDKELAQSVSHAVMTPALIDEAKRTVDRRTSRYSSIMRIIELLVRGTAVQLDDGDHETISLQGFAVDMNSLWQRLLGRVLVEWIPEIQVRPEATLTEVVRLDPTFSQNRKGRLPRPRPDFAVREGGGPVVYLDAKYRDLWETSLPRDMLYQIALYAAVQEHGIATMLYPTEAKAALEERLDVHNPMDNTKKATVVLRPIDVGQLEDLVVAPPGRARDEARQTFGRRLVGSV